jgi:hypothetical protein
VAQGARDNIEFDPRADAATIPQAQIRFRRGGPYKNVSRETFLSDLGPKPYKALDGGPPCNGTAVRFSGAIGIRVKATLQNFDR